MKKALGVVEKYQGNYPRYTSYPTAVEFRPIESVNEAGSAYRCLSAKSDKHRLSLYIHLPYCPSLCYFCACNKIISNKAEVYQEYLSFLNAELEILTSKLPKDYEISQIHLGGGSPSYLSIEDLQRLLEILTSLRTSIECKKSVEIDPRTIDSKKLDIFYYMGFRRFSLGIQDFDPGVQKIVNRIQPYELARDLTQEIKDYRGTSVNFDLIYGLPGQTERSIANTIEKVIELSPDRIALYGYAHVNWKTKVQNVFNKLEIPGGRERAAYFELASHTLQTAGYKYIGLDHFARPNDELTQAMLSGNLRRNFMGYTTVEGSSLIGAGVSAISDLDDCMLQNSTDIEDYKKSLLAGQIPVSKIIVRTLEDKIRSSIIEDIMCSRSICLEKLVKTFKDQNLCNFVYQNGLSNLCQMLKDGMVVNENNSISVTNQGRYFLRQIASCFDSYFLSSEKSDRRFSAH